MLNLDTLSPVQYRARYEELQAKARDRATTLPASTAAPLIVPATVIHADSIPPGCYAMIRAKRGHALHIANPNGTAGASLMLWNADDPTERYNAGDTVKLQWTTILTAGRVLFSDMGRVLAAIIADSGAGHDAILGPSTPRTNPGARNGGDNLRNAAAKFGLGRRDVAPSLTLFANLRTDADGRMHLHGTPAPGSFTTLRANMNLLIALSNTPHPLADSQQATGPIETTLYRAPASAADDLCRNFSEEAIRGYQNTDPLFA